MGWQLRIARHAVYIKRELEDEQPPATRAFAPLKLPLPSFPHHQSPRTRFHRNRNEDTLTTRKKKKKGKTDRSTAARLCSKDDGHCQDGGDPSGSVHSFVSDRPELGCNGRRSCAGKSAQFPETVMGTVYCDFCSNNSFSRHSYFLPGNSWWMKSFLLLPYPCEIELTVFLLCSGEGTHEHGARFVLPPSIN